MENAAPKLLSRVPAWAKKAVPALISLLILYYYFHDQDWTALWAATAHARLWLALLAIVVPQLIYWALEVLLTERTMTWFHAPFPWRPYFWVRGAIYILQILNPTLAGGGTLLYIQRRTLIPWRRFAGILLFRFGMTMWALTLFLIPATLAMHYYGLAERARLNLWVWWGFLIFGVAWMVEAWVVWHHQKHFGLSKLVVRDRESEFWTAFRLATRGQWLATGALALAPMLFVLFGFYLLALAFEVRVPFWHFLVVAPLVMLIMDLPIALAGFGTTTLAWMTFFGEFGSEENLAALSLFLPFARSICRGLIGLVSLRPALTDLAALPPAPAGEPASPAFLEREEA